MQWRKNLLGTQDTEFLMMVQLPLECALSGGPTEEEVTLLIGQVSSLLLSLNSCALWLVQERSSRLAIAGIWERTWLEYSTLASGLRIIADRLRMLRRFSGLSLKISVFPDDGWHDLSDWLLSTVSGWEMDVSRWTTT